MRVQHSNQSEAPSSDVRFRPAGLQRGASHDHPVLRRALDAHQGDRPLDQGGLAHGRSGRGSNGARTPLVRFSSGFLGDAREAGVTAPQVRAALGSGVRERCWDGCLLVHDWFQGVELKLDPTGRFGLALRRTHAVN